MIKSNLTFDYAKSVEPIRLYNTNSNNSIVQKLRRAAEVHVKARKELRDKIKPGMKYLDACNIVENSVVKTFGQNDLQRGMGFPVGISVNEIAAHDSAMPNDQRVFKKDDVIKIDFGTHEDGYIIDTAWTHTFSNKYENLVEATKDATLTAIHNSGPDANIADISKIIQETIESYEQEINGKTCEIKAIKGLGGHNIIKNVIHGGKIILSRPDYPLDYPPDKLRMDVDEIYAIETFASTGSGVIKQADVPVTHFMLNKSYTKVDFKFDITKSVYNWIIKKRGTLPFSILWIDKDLKQGNKIKIGLNELVRNNIITACPALDDDKGAYTSQSEHTIYLHDYGKEILSHGDDY